MVCAGGSAGIGKGGMMKMVEVKVSELQGAALDLAVASIEGYDLMKHPFRRAFIPGVGHVDYSPSTDWSQGGLLIERYSVSIAAHVAGKVKACVGIDVIPYARAVSTQGGPTHLIAACRAIVSAKLGDTVQIPAELA